MCHAVLSIVCHFFTTPRRPATSLGTAAETPGQCLDHRCPLGFDAFPSAKGPIGMLVLHKEAGMQGSGDLGRKSVAGGDGTVDAGPGTLDHPRGPSKTWVAVLSIEWSRGASEWLR